MGEGGGGGGRKREKADKKKEETNQCLTVTACSGKHQGERKREEYEGRREEEKIEPDSEEAKQRNRVINERTTEEKRERNLLSGNRGKHTDEGNREKDHKAKMRNGKGKKKNLAEDKKKIRYRRCGQKGKTHKRMTQ